MDTGTPLAHATRISVRPVRRLAKVAGLILILMLCVVATFVSSPGGFGDTDALVTVVGTILTLAIGMSLFSLLRTGEGLGSLLLRILGLAGPPLVLGCATGLQPVIGGLGDDFCSIAQVLCLVLALVAMFLAAWRWTTGVDQGSYGDIGSLKKLRAHVLDEIARVEGSQPVAAVSRAARLKVPVGLRAQSRDIRSLLARIDAALGSHVGDRERRRVSGQLAREANATLGRNVENATQGRKASPVEALLLVFVLFSLLLTPGLGGPVPYAAPAATIGAVHLLLDLRILSLSLYGAAALLSGFRAALSEERTPVPGGSFRSRHVLRQSRGTGLWFTILDVLAAAWSALTLVASAVAEVVWIVLFTLADYLWRTFAHAARKTWNTMKRRRFWTGVVVSTAWFYVFVLMGFFAVDTAESAVIYLKADTGLQAVFGANSCAPGLFALSHVAAFYVAGLFGLILVTSLLSSWVEGREDWRAQELHRTAATGILVAVAMGAAGHILVAINAVFGLGMSGFAHLGIYGILCAALFVAAMAMQIVRSRTRARNRPSP